MVIGTDGHVQPGIENSCVKTFISGLTLVLGLAGVVHAANYPPALTGDVIIKFTDKSQAGQLMAEALHSDSNQHAPLQTMARQLSAEMDVPLSALRLTSGRELVVSIDRPVLARSLKERLLREPAVQRVIVLETGKTVLPAGELAVRVNLRSDSIVQRQVQRDRHAGQRTSVELDKQVAGLVSGVAPRPSAHIDNHGRLILTLDIAELIDDLIIRLKGRADVVYAQANLVVRPSLKRQISPVPAGPP